MEESFASGKLVVDGSKRMNKYPGRALGIYTRYFQDGRRLSERQSNNLVGIGEQEGWFGKVGGLLRR